MNRGDTRTLIFKIKSKSGYIDGSDYEDVEVQLNKQGLFNAIKKLKSKGEVVWNTDHFETYLSQEDTFTLTDGTAQIQVRLFNDGSVKGTLVAKIKVGESLSEDVLGDGDEDA